MALQYKIDIVSDVSCPWCVIGYQSLASAIEEIGVGSYVDISWIPFELNPNMPVEGQNRDQYIREKYGLSAEQTLANRENLIARGKAVGYQFNFAPEGRVYNTFNAHRLIYWAKSASLQTELKLALFDLFFQRQGNPSDQDDLLDCVERVGLDVTQAREILDSDRYEDEVRKELNFAHQNGITSVPAFIFNNKYLVSGGQPTETFINVFKELGKSTD